MKIALFGKVFTDDRFNYLQLLLDKLTNEGIEIMIGQEFYEFIQSKVIITGDVKTFNKQSDIEGIADFLISVGGDGTMLDAITYIGNSGIPVMGINLGRMGFLSGIHKEEIDPAIDALLQGNYRIDKRSLLRLETKDNLFGQFNYALNELTINKKGTGSMILVYVYVNNVLLNAYWGDGIIIATPTGSTAYSLSCNGPILAPESENFVITPIATHNLTVRPVVIPDNSELKVRVEGRIAEFLVGLDSRYETIDATTEMTVRKENFHINLVQRLNDNFFTTIRQKLLWGRDIRI
ncbi:MAG TPA: NAD kinase [Lentimicrobium sp.]|nr:NAD kinase [Lentimicrobium sp.]